MLKILSFLISVNILLCFSQDKQNESILIELYNFFVSHTDPTISYTEQYTMCEKAITKYISTSNYTYLWNFVKQIFNIFLSFFKKTHHWFYAFSSNHMEYLHPQ